MRHIVAPQFVGHDLTWLSTAASQKALKETLCGTAVSMRLKIHINNFAILVHGSPEVMLLATIAHDDLVDEKRIAVPLMVSLQSPGKFPAALYAPEAY